MAKAGDNHRLLTPDGVIGEVAGRQEGRIASRQLHALRVTTDEIEYRLRIGRLHRVGWGVYAVGSPHSTLNARRWEVVLACGPRAVLSHGAAARLWGIVLTPQRLEVTAPRRVRRRRIVAHQATLPPDEVTTDLGIPVTTANRTLLDLAARWKPDAVTRALNQAEANALYEYQSLLDLVHRHPMHPGAFTIRRILVDRDPATTRSPSEDYVHAFLVERDFPRALVNHWMEVGGEHFMPDFVWLEEKVIVEAYSKFHRTQDQIDRDDDRDAVLQAHGWAVLHVTQRQLRRNPDRVARRLWDLLNRRAVAA
jgi:very-short-patch-repair endonuclease